jgi:hypothetical protein
MSRKVEIGSRYFNTARKRWVIKTEDGWIEEHRYVMEKSLGRKLTKNEIVHHIDHDKLNNDISNLELTSRSEHMRHHSTGRTYKHSEETKKLLSDKAKQQMAQPGMKEKISKLTKEAMQREDVKERYWKGFNKHLDKFKH